MWLEIEGGVLLNIDLIERVETKPHEDAASMWAGGVRMCSDSRIAYRYFQAERSNPDSKYFVKAPPPQE